MSFSSAILASGRQMAGSMRMNFGTFTNDGGSTGGNINTGLESCHLLIPLHSGAAVVADAPSVNESFPCAGNAVTVVNTADTSGYWIAFGY